MSNKIRVLIADDHMMVREGLKQIIELEEDIEVIAQASDGEDAYNLIKEVNPDVVLLDINMPIFNGLEVLTKLKEDEFECNILMLTIHNEVEYLYKAVELGVNGYILKDSEADALIKAIRLIYKGETYIQPNMASLLFKMINGELEKKSKHETLSAREVEVLGLLAKGLLNKQIAEKLGISEKTIKNHISRIYKKIGVADRTQAAVYAIKNNIVG